MTEHFVQIEIGKNAYRFFGRGEWKKLDDRQWRTVNAIYIPGEVLRIAASQCSSAREEDDSDYGEPPIICPVTCQPCTTEQDEFCEDYGCARQTGIDVDRDLII